MRLRIYVSALLLWAASVETALGASDWPAMRSCAPILECEDGLGKLTDEENKLIHKLLTIVTPGATETQITQRFGRPPFDIIPPLPPGASRSGIDLYKALWSTAEPPERSYGPHFDVLFVNGRAVGFNWYAARIRKIVRVQIAPM